MKIISKTGKRIDGKASEKEVKNILKEEDPIIRNAEKGEIDELSPMDPPDGFDEKRTVGLNYSLLHPILKELCNEHKEVMVKCDAFEEAIIAFKDGGFYITKEINDAFNAFFVAFDEEILPHHKKEEQTLFPILRKKLLESGEHSTGEQPHTPVDLMEEEHIKLVQLTTLTFNLLGLAMRLKDPEDIAMTFDLAYNNGKELAELVKLHIFREDNTIFPLAQELLTEKELNSLHE
jgi:hemerythrin-like domain-containing protein